MLSMEPGSRMEKWAVLYRKVAGKKTVIEIKLGKTGKEIKACSRFLFRSDMCYCAMLKR